MVLVNKNEGLKEEYPMDKTFSAEYDFSCVRQIACADRFARVLMRAMSNKKACTQATEHMLLKQATRKSK